MKKWRRRQQTESEGWEGREDLASAWRSLTGQKARSRRGWGGRSGALPPPPSPRLLLPSGLQAPEQHFPDHGGWEEGPLEVTPAPSGPPAAGCPGLLPLACSPPRGWQWGSRPPQKHASSERKKKKGTRSARKGPQAKRQSKPLWLCLTKSLWGRRGRAARPATRVSPPLSHPVPLPPAWRASAAHAPTGGASACPHACGAATKATPSPALRGRRAAQAG